MYLRKREEKEKWVALVQLSSGCKKYIYKEKQGWHLEAYDPLIPLSELWSDLKSPAKPLG